MKRFDAMKVSRWLCVVCMILLVGSVSAQNLTILPGLEDALAPDFLRRDMQLLRRDLNLDEDQTLIVQTLFNEYETDFKNGADGVRQELGRIAPLLGREDPQVTEKREEIRRQLAARLEELRQADAGSGDPQAVMQRIEALRQELLALQQGQTSIEDLRKSLAEVQGHLEQWRSQRKQLRGKFVDSLQAVLHPAQQPLWTSVERTIRRERSLPRGRLAGEMADLIQITGEMQLAPPPAPAQAQASPLQTQLAVAEALDAYAVKLDAALRARDQAIEDGHQAMLNAMRSKDVAAVEHVLEAQTRLRVAVRDVNDSAAASIAAQFSPEQREAFTQAYQTRAYGRIFRSTKTQRLFKSARELQSWPPETLAAIDQLEQSYLSELKSANEKLLASLREHEPAELTNRLLMKWSQAEAPEQDTKSPVDDQFLRRGELDDRFAKQLQSLLPAAQWQQLMPTDHG